MTVEVCSRVGVRVSPAPGALKEESSSPGGRRSTSPAHETIEVPASRPKFMITDILAQQKPTSPLQGDSSSHVPTIDEPKDLRIPRHIHPEEDEDVDVDLDCDNDDDDEDSDSKFLSNRKFYIASRKPIFLFRLL